ncbi:MAG: 30S ribosomal protein S13 [Candidatus Omnitrophica bacterium]|nr:30S ribosomal protein S13 [Candidatus Omnitrophota bacterium]
MPRIVGVDLPKEKRIDIALTYLHGIGRSTAAQVLTKAQVDPAIRAKDLTEDQITRITSAVSQGYKVEGDLKREISQNIKRLIDIGSYRGLRHRRGLPVRGQRTHTNARTRKGPRRIIGVRKKPAAPVAAKG